MKTSKWTQSQINLLLENTKDGNVRMRAFEEVAEATGRKPNSVRNFYYKLISGGGHVSHNKQKFVSFSSADATTLLREIVLGTSRGESVRAVCMKLSAGDRSRMLRLQNKYRAILAKNPQRISDTVKLLEQQGYLVKSPISNKRPLTAKRQIIRDRFIGGTGSLRSGGDNNVIFMQEHSNKKLTDTDINNLFMGLVRLIKRGALDEQTSALKQQISALKAEIENLKRNNGELGNI